MVCHGGFSLDEGTRRNWYNPEAILKDAGLAVGTIFVDVGCGEGFFTLLAAKAVGETGMVYAVDTDAEAIERLKDKAEKQHLRNIKVRIGPAEETVFCKECADLVFYSMVLHDFKDPLKVLQNAKKMLKPQSTLLDLDWKKAQTPFGPPFKIRFSEQDAMGLLKISGFTTTKQQEAGLYHYIITAKPSKQC
jgi:ubiquinone/menaquinone biosynthesis C-methylase UbiE